MSTEAKIAIVGGGVAGATAALYLSEIGLKISLFEKKQCLVNGPPFCHLHAGGNLYREISDEQCITLLKESIDFLRFYPQVVDYRPTVIVLPKDDKGKPEDLLPRLHILRDEYETLIQADVHNKVLGESTDYFKLFDRQKMEQLRKEEIVDSPSTIDEWMIPVAKNIDFDKVQFPLLMVQEYGLNLFRLAASVTLALEKISNCRVFFNTKVTDIKKNEQKEGWNVSYAYKGENKKEHFDYLINAAGFRSGKVDDMLGFKRQRFVEFKAAYVSKWNDQNTIWPEVVFYGERGTPQGMAQFTPYPGGYFQLHGMTKNITLFTEGLVKSSKQSAQPELNRDFLEKLENNWKWSDIRERSQSAINHLSQFIPSFSLGEVGSKPLYGAQQIPGLDDSLRAADVSFEERYARCEIVKVSSALSAVDAIMKELIHLGYVDQKLYQKRDFTSIKSLKESDIDAYAKSLCRARDYPTCLAGRNVSSPQH